MAISKIILNGVAQMDVTGKTVTSASMRNGITALKNDGTDITGSIQDMTLPSAASSTSSGTAKATIAPTSSAQYLNIPAGYLETAQFYTIAAASGGASNMVTGTFKGTTTGAAMDINVPYTGSGYPIAVMIYPSEGAYNSSGTFYNLLQRYATWLYSACKCVPSVAPTYPTSSSTANTDSMSVWHVYKGSASNATSGTAARNLNTNVYRNYDAVSGSSGQFVVSIKSNTKLSVFIASNSYGFAANIEYTYRIIYSS